MDTYSVSDDLPAAARGAAIALGNFDGLHAGHRAVIDDARASADSRGAPLAVATFEPAPRRFFQPDAPPFRIMTPLRRQIGLERLDVDLCLLLRFDAAMAGLMHDQFAARVLRDQIGAASVSVGYDFRFGRARKGDARALVQLGAENGFEGRIVAEVDQGGAKASSTRIRQMIQDGDMAAAAEALGDWWVVDGEVEHGEKRGRTLGFPTANLRLGEIIHPAHGVYAVWARTDDQPWRPGVANFGRTPTTGLRDPLLEVVLFDWTGDLYGRRLHVAFAKWLRPEVAYAGIDPLVAQMKLDASQARTVLAGLSVPRN